ncbi:MAG: helix-turn-helix transcriptional regulator [Clostridia bacterium]|nr:helix-turn-helix transcriptional regulator [Clostridia bacterium]MBQ4158186.1 helix-turn-helix transcriptional regulator [Clostridia bacterium]
MSIAFNISRRHKVKAANSHYYENPTASLYIDRILEYHDLIYLEQGQWLITEGDTDYLLEKGDVLLLSAGHHHYTRLPCSPQTRTICIHISNEPGDLSPEGGALVLPTHMHVKHNVKVRDYFRQITSCFWSDEAYKEEKLSALFNLLVLELADMRTGKKDAETTIAEEIIQMINLHPYINYKLQDVADQLNVSKKVISGAMLKSVGETFSKYQLRRKVEMVEKQIRVEPNTRFSEIATNFGFCDEFHMSRCFKSVYGVSPSEYRNRIVGYDKDKQTE